MRLGADARSLRRAQSLAAAVLLIAGLAAGASARKQIAGGDTVFETSAEPTKDAAFLTPFPVEMPDAAAGLPDGLALKLPWEAGTSHKITQGYGFQAPGWTHQTIGNTMSANDFYAIDIAMPEGTPVLAPAPGRILMANDRSGRDSYGIYVVIDHGNGVRSIYAHLSDIALEPISPEGEPKVWIQHGDPEVYVETGSLIGWSGQTGTTGGPHLHYCMHRGSFMAESGADIAGQAVRPEPISGYYGLRQGHLLTSDNEMIVSEAAQKIIDRRAAEAASVLVVPAIEEPAATPAAEKPIAPPPSMGDPGVTDPLPTDLNQGHRR